MADDLLWAVKNGDLEAIKKSSYDLNGELTGGRRAIHVAADYGHCDVIKYLLSKGADVNLPDKHGITALLAAIYEGHVECVELLLSKGAKKDLKAPDGTAYVDCAESDAIKSLLK